MGENGRLGEAYAARWLEQKGYHILATNFRTRFGEIDVIAGKGEALAFVEVKTRAKTSLGRPAAAVSLAKQRKLILAAQGYLQDNPTELWPRFDVIEIITESSDGFRVVRVRHLENAFLLTEENSSR